MVKAVRGRVVSGQRLRVLLAGAALYVGAVFAFAAGDLPQAMTSGGPAGQDAGEGVPLGPDGRIHVPGDAFVSALLADASSQVRLGADRYHLVCAACHGNSGLGPEEGRAAFPPSHQRCERCHRPSNPPRLPTAAITPRNAFSLGQPPALRGPGALAAFPSGASLYAYVRAAMPRYHPGLLTDDEYLAVTAFLLSLDGRMPPADTLQGANEPAGAP